MKVKQLGNGGGFDFDKTNSSFLLTCDKEPNEYLLVDCGYNIMSALKALPDIGIEDINSVYITHLDEDHVGNLQMFIQARYYLFGLETTVYCAYSLRDELYNYLQMINYSMIGGQMLKNDMFKILQLQDFKPFRIQNTYCYHGNQKAFGLFANSDSHCVYISGDTKASKMIEDEVELKYRQVTTNNEHRSIIKFHDFSNWDCVTRQVHTCKTDWEIEYSVEWQESCIKYHNNEEFNSEWQTKG